MNSMPPCCAYLPLGCTTRPIGEDTEENVLSLEASSAFLFSQFQYLWVVICFNTSAPFRKSLTTNGLLFWTWVLLMAISVFLLLAPDELIIVADYYIPSLQIQLFPTQIFKWKLLGLALINFAASYREPSFVFQLIDSLFSTSLSSTYPPLAMSLVLPPRLFAPHIATHFEDG